MVTDEQVQQLQLTFKRVFALPMSKMTLREVQNAVTTAFPNHVEMSRALLESLMAGEASKELNEIQKFKRLIDEYSP